MASKYDDLDASTELEQVLAADLKAGLEGRGVDVVHNGTNSGGRHAPGGKADIEVRDHPNKRLILVEVTRRKMSSADGEFIAVTDHLDKAIAAGGYDDYGVLYVSPATSARLSSNFRDLLNRSRERDKKKGRIVAIDFATAQMMLEILSTTPSDLYPAARIGDTFERWAEAEDDSLARLLVQRTIFPEDIDLAVELETEVEDFAADRERTLKNELERIENDLRERGVVGDDANRALVYLTFIRLYEERTQRLLGKPSRFTVDGFEEWRSAQPQTVVNRFRNRMVEALLHEIAEDPDLVGAGLLRDSKGAAHNLHEKVWDQFVVSKLLPVFDKYDFHVGRLDVLGAVFETLARRGEKDTRIGQFFTPQPVVHFCADIVPLKARDTVLDPAVGTARFLIKAMNMMMDRAESTAEKKAVKSSRLLGVDIGAWVATIAKMNMYIHGDGKTNIREANGLVLGDRAIFKQFPEGLSGNVDVVLTNPPLGETSHVVAVEHWIEFARAGDSKDRNVLLNRLGVVPMRVPEITKLATAENDLAIVEARIIDFEKQLPDQGAQRTLASARRTRARLTGKIGSLRAHIASGSAVSEPVNESMKGGALFLGAIADYLKLVRDPDAPAEWRGGWAAIVVDEAILNTPDYGDVRKFIRDRFYIKAVISLGRQAFVYLAHTDAKTSVMFLVRKPEPGKVQIEPTFYAHAEKVGYGRAGEWVGNDLQSIELNYREFQNAVKKQYKGAWFDMDGAQKASETMSGFGHAFHSMPDSGGASRLDFYNARNVQLIRELREHFGELKILGDYLAVAEIKHPEPNRRGEYAFAQINRVEGTVRPKGIEAVKYSPRALWIVREGLLVVSGIDALHGSVAVAGSDVDGMVMSIEMYGYCVKDHNAASAVYLQLLIRSSGARQLIEGMTTGTSNRTRLESAEQLLQLPIPPLPPIEGQRATAKKFERSLASYRSARETQREVEGNVAGLWQFAELFPEMEADVDTNQFTNLESKANG